MGPLPEKEEHAHENGIWYSRTSNVCRREENADLVESAQLARVAALAADDKKARDVKILDIRTISTVSDYFVICAGWSNTHVRAIADNVEAQLSGCGLTLHHIEGYQNGRWILLDYGDLVVHVMHEEERGFYNLERLWGDAQEVRMPHSAAG
jgi:ribosome-associated protein